MADVAKNAVVTDAAWRSGGLNNRRFLNKRVKVTLSTQGGNTNKVPASVFNMSKIKSCGSAVKSDNSVIVPCAPSVDGLRLIFGGGAANIAADYSGDFYVTVVGYSA